MSDRREVELVTINAEGQEVGDVFRISGRTLLVITMNHGERPLTSGNALDALRVAYPDAEVLILPHGWTFRAYEVRWNLSSNEPVTEQVAAQEPEQPEQGQTVPTQPIP